METLNSTEPHYVRCIKPNDAKEAFRFEPKYVCSSSGFSLSLFRRVVQQLRACCVLETVRISAAGYPSRWMYREFLNRYQMLLAPARGVVRSQLIGASLQAECERIIRKAIPDGTKYQFGATKVFFRAGQVAYLEKLRADRMRSAAIVMQARVRGFVKRRKYQRLKLASIGLQTYIRGKLARMHAEQLRRTAAAVVLQASARRFIARQRFLRIRSLVVDLQSRIRGFKIRKQFKALRHHFMAVKIQSLIRSYLARQRALLYLKRVVLAQSCIRRHLAKRQLRQLRIEARSVEGLKQVNFGLERKIIELQQKMDQRVREATVKQQEKMAELEKALEKAQHAASESTQSQQMTSQHDKQDLDDLRHRLVQSEERCKVLEARLLEVQTHFDSTVKDMAAKVIQRL